MITWIVSRFTKLSVSFQVFLVGAVVGWVIFALIASITLVAVRATAIEYNHLLVWGLVATSGLVSGGIAVGIHAIMSFASYWNKSVKNWYYRSG